MHRNTQLRDALFRAFAGQHVSVTHRVDVRSSKPAAPNTPPTVAAPIDRSVQMPGRCTTKRM